MSESKNQSPLCAKDLCRRFGRIRAVDKISFSLRPGCVTGFLGPNGAGKSTTLSMIGGLLRPDAGSIRIGGKRVGRDGPKVFHKVGFALERSTFYDYLSGEKNLEIEAILRDSLDWDRIETILRKVGLEEAAGRRVGGYSQGMRQRLAIARALISEPKLLILDEPTTGLDVEGTEDILDLIRAEARRRGTTVFLSSHHLAEIERICDDVIVIDHGRIIASGRVRELVREEEVEVLVSLENPAGIKEWLENHPRFKQVKVGQRGRVLFRLSRRDIHGLLAGLIGGGLVIRDIAVRTQNLKDFFLKTLRK